MAIGRPHNNAQNKKDKDYAHVRVMPLSHAKFDRWWRLGLSISIVWGVPPAEVKSGRPCRDHPVCTSEAHPNRAAAAVADRDFPTDATNPSQVDGDRIGPFSIIPPLKSLFASRGQPPIANVVRPAAQSPVSFGANNAQTLEPPVIPIVTKVPVWESVMKANQAEFRTILRAAVPMVVGIALPSYATASFALGTAEQRLA